MSAIDLSANIGTTAVREQHRFDEGALAAYLAQHVAGFTGPLTVEQFKGGQSNPTYRLTAGSARYASRRDSCCRRRTRSSASSR